MKIIHRIKIFHLLKSVSNKNMSQTLYINKVKIFHIVLKTYFYYVVMESFMGCNIIEGKLALVKFFS